MSKLFFDIKVENKAEVRVTVELFVPEIKFGSHSKAIKIEHGQYICFEQIGNLFQKPPHSLVKRNHSCAGVVSISKLAPYNQFSITLGKSVFLDSKNFVIGQVVSGMDALRDLESIPLETSGKPRVLISLSSSGGEEEVEEERHEETRGQSGGTATSQRMFELQLKMNKARQLNNQAVIMEKKRLTDPKAYMQSLNQKEGEKEEADPLLHQTAEIVSKKRGPKGETFAWDMFNEDSQYKAHDKRVDQMGFYPDAYERQKETMGEAFFEATNVGHKPSEEAKERLVESIKMAGEKRKEFSRRRVQNDEKDDVLWINEKNKQFTKRIERAFGKHTAEIKANLERGTAL